MSGPIVRSGPSPQFSKNWESVFGKGGATTLPSAGKKASKKAAAKKSPKKATGKKAPGKKTQKSGK